MERWRERSRKRILGERGRKENKVTAEKKKVQQASLIQATGNVTAQMIQRRRVENRERKSEREREGQTEKERQTEREIARRRKKRRDVQNKTAREADRQ